MRAKFSAVTAIATALAMSIAGVASAAAAEFNASKGGTLSAKALAIQTFKTSTGNIECKSLTATGTIAEGKKATQAAVVTYGECTAFGKKATVTPAHYLFNANGSVTVQETITVTATVEGKIVCTVTVGPQTLLDDEAEQEGVVYENLSSGNLKLIPEPVEGITSTGVGTLALCNYGTESNGTYTGASEVHNSGGTIEIEGVQP